MTGPPSPTAFPSHVDLATPSPANPSVGHSRNSSASKKLAPLSRSNSLRTRGMNFNIAVSPVSTHPSPSQTSLNSSAHKRSSSVFSINNSNPTSTSTSNSNSSTNSIINTNTNTSANTAHIQSQASLPQLLESSPSSTIPSSPIPSATEELKYDLPLPPTEQLLNLDIDDQLRLLALKEMSVVEIKDNITSLTNKLNRHEKELHKLREVIQRSLYKELSSQNDSSNNSLGKHIRQNSNPREEAIASTRTGSRRRTLSSSSTHHIPTQQNDTEHNLLSPSQQNQPQFVLSNPHTINNSNKTKRQSSLWSNLSKPLNLIQQFDSMLQNEFERSLVPSQQQQSTSDGIIPYHNKKPSVSESSSQNHNYSRNKPRKSEDSFSSTDSSVPSPLKSKSDSKSNVNLDQFFPPTSDILDMEDKERRLQFSKHKNSEDMMQTVSSSIWTFVNDVKSNVLSSLGEDDAQYKQDKSRQSSRSPNISSNSFSKSNFSSRSNSKLNLEVKTMNEPMYNLETGSTISVNEDDVPTSSISSTANTTLKQNNDSLNMSELDSLDENDNNDDDDDSGQVDLSIYSLLRKRELSD